MTQHEVDDRRPDEAEQGGPDAERAQAGGRTTDRIIASVEALAGPIVETAGCWLDRIEYKTAGRKGWLQVFIDRQGGVTIDDCAEVSRQLGAALDAHEIFARAYTLEVSSPGLTRPLKARRDFERYAGRLAVMHLRRPVGGRREVTGTLRGVEGEEVLVEVVGRKGADTVRVPLDAIAKARLEIDA